MRRTRPDRARPPRPHPRVRNRLASATRPTPADRTARRSFNGLPAFGDDLVNIVVKPAAEVDAARI